MSLSLPVQLNFNLDLVGDMVNHLIGELESNPSIGPFNIYPFQSVFLPSDENLLAYMVY